MTNATVPEQLLHAVQDHTTDMRRWLETDNNCETLMAHLQHEPVDAARLRTYRRHDPPPMLEYLRRGNDERPYSSRKRQAAAAGHPVQAVAERRTGKVTGETASGRRFTLTGILRHGRYRDAVRPIAPSV